MPKDVNEVILVDDKDQLYEGMSSNFLAVKLVNDKPVVICASLDHILLGSILKIVISICKKHDIEMKWDFPRVNDAKQGKWIGCFIASKYNPISQRMMINRFPKALRDCYFP
jgi:branched-subunit amino acid aminotransferase/4-amino-4-deoxychorismate lyase